MKLSIETITNEIKDLLEEDEFKTYKASPLLEELIGINQYLLDHLENKQDLYDIYERYIFIADTYKRMGRFSIAAYNHEKALDISIKIYHECDNQVKGVDNLLYNILKERNYYVDDDCLDVLTKVKDTRMIEPHIIDKIFNSVTSNRRSFNHDPIEMSEEYLKVIDEVEEKIDKNRKLHGMGSCHEIWMLKEQYLLQKGIKWSSPQVLNPRVMFD